MLVQANVQGVDFMTESVGLYYSIILFPIKLIVRNKKHNYIYKTVFIITTTITFFFALQRGRHTKKTDKKKDKKVKEKI